MKGVYFMPVVIDATMRYKPETNLSFCSCYNNSHLMLRLHYVPGGHGSHFSDHHGQNGVTVRQFEGTGTTNVARRGRRDKFLKCQKISTAATAATAGSTHFMCRSRTVRTQQNVTGRNRP